MITHTEGDPPGSYDRLISTEYWLLLTDWLLLNSKARTFCILSKTKMNHLVLRGIYAPILKCYRVHFDGHSHWIWWCDDLLCYIRPTCILACRRTHLAVTKFEVMEMLWPRLIATPHSAASYPGRAVWYTAMCCCSPSLSAGNALLKGLFSWVLKEYESFIYSPRALFVLPRDKMVPFLCARKAGPLFHHKVTLKQTLNCPTSLKSLKGHSQLHISHWYTIGWHIGS